jgi:hypothetical protein
LLTGAPGTSVEVAVVSKGAAPRTATITRQVLGQPPPAKCSTSKGAEMLAGAQLEDRKDSALTRKGQSIGSKSVGAESPQRTMPRPLSTSSDASFVHVDGCWDDCFTALAQEDVAGRAMERLDAAVQAWRTGSDPRGDDPRSCDARILHFFAAWARELNAVEVQQVPAGADCGIEELAMEHTCGNHVRAKSAPTALIMLSFGGRSRQARGASTCTSPCNSPLPAALSRLCVSASTHPPIAFSHTILCSLLSSRWQAHVGTPPRGRITCHSLSLL